MKNPAISTLLFRAFKQIKLQFETGKCSLSQIEQSLIINEMKSLLADNLICSDFKFLCNTHDFLHNYYLSIANSIQPDVIHDPILSELIDLLNTECWDYLKQNSTQNKKFLEMIIVILVHSTSMYANTLLEIARHAILDTELHYEKIERCIADFFDQTKHYSLKKIHIYTLESHRYMSIYQRATLEKLKGNLEFARVLIKQCLSFTECYTDHFPDDTFKNACLELSTELSSEVIPVEKKKRKSKSKKSSVMTPQIATAEELVHKHQTFLNEFEQRLTSPIELNECRAMCERIKESLSACVTCEHLNSGLEQFDKTLEFIAKYIFPVSESYSGINDLLNGSLSVSVLSQLPTIIIDVISSKL